MGLGFLEQLDWRPNPCRHCTPEEEFRVRYARGSGCSECRQTGYGPQLRLLAAPADETFGGGTKGYGKGQASYLCHLTGTMRGMVSTPFGFRSIMDLQVGSPISNPDGSVQQVVHIYELGEQDLYKVSFSDGASTVTTLDHLWNIHVVGKTTKSDQRYHPFEEEDRIGNWKVTTTEQLIGLLEKASSSQATIKPNIHIPLTEPVRFTMAPGGVKPWELMPSYLWGLILGDGWSVGGAMAWSKPDRELVEKVQRMTGKSVSSSGNTNRILQSREYYDAWEKFGLAGKKSPEKFIPEPFLVAPIEHRWELIRGLMDSDGYAAENGHCYFSTTSQEMARQFQHLARSLGFTATDCVKSAGYRNDDGVKVECNDSHEIHLQGKRKEELFSLARKKDRVLPYNGGNGGEARRLTSIEKCGRAPARCIKVSNPNSLYITDDFIVTHNSDAGKVWLLSGNIGEEDGPLRKVPLRGVKDPQGNQRYVITGGVHYSYVFQRNYRALVTRLNQDDLDAWVQSFLPLAERMGGRYVGRPFDEFRFPDREGNPDMGGRISLSHLKDYASYMKYQGAPELHRWLAEELAQLPSETDFESVLTCVRSATDSMRAQMLATANPEGPGVIWVANRFVDLKDHRGVLIPEGTIVDVRSHNDLTGEETVRTRVFISGSLLDNPRLDKSYIANLNSISDPRRRRALLLGKWDAAVGSFFPEFRQIRFEGEPATAHHVYDPATTVIQPWWRRSIGMDWGYSGHQFSVHWGTQNPDTEQIYVEEEMTGRLVAASKVGKMIAERSLKYLNASPESTIQMFLSHEAYGRRNDEGGGITRIAQMILRGIQSVLGPQGASSPELELHALADEQDIGYYDFITKYHEVYRRVEEKRRYGIVLRKALSDRAVRWALMHDLLRWRPLDDKPVPEMDEATWQMIGRAIGAGAAVSYAHSFDRKPEHRPGVLIHPECHGLFAGFKGARSDPKDPEKIDDRHFYGRDQIDSASFLLAGIAYVKTDDHIPLEVRWQRRLEEYNASRGASGKGSMTEVLRMRGIFERQESGSHNGGAVWLGAERGASRRGPGRNRGAGGRLGGRFSR